MKYLVLLVVVGGVMWWMLSRRPVVKQRKRQTQAPQHMVVCAHCKVHLPAPEATLSDGMAYCSEAHRVAGPK